ncbi:MAG TPA: ATP-binding protein [Burkholderiales bacterium]|nr:ATP-binding protein [Burkholderiales bacterium]
MPSPLQVLILEDEPTDVVLIERALARHFPDLVLTHAQTKEQYLDHLASPQLDIVLSDNSIAGCEGLKAFHLARERRPRIPFIYVSGFDDPGRDVQGLKALGVNDFLSKSDLAQLGPAVERALQDRGRADADDARLLAGYERLVSVVRQLSLARDLPTIMEIVRRAARELTGADGATFVLRDGDFCHYADEDAIGPLWKGQKFPMHTCISGWAMTHRQPAVVEDIYSDPRIPVSAYEPTFVRSVAMVPIRAMEPIGAIGNYWARRRQPAPWEVRLLQALADTTAVAMENVRVYNELEARVRERTAELEAFTYAVSHDLRAPLRHVNAFTDILLEDHGAKLDEKVRDGLQRITRATARMAEMINALLQLSLTTQLPVRRGSLDLARLAREVAEECKAAAKRDVEFVAPASLPVTGDPTLLRIALHNLLGNAWKFSSNREAPRVELGVRSQPGAQRVYYIQDNGAGFDMSGAAKLFGVFQRLHSENEFPGTGVGLATVQRIIRKHGGQIWASGKPGEGATFFFTLGDDAGPA